MPYIAAINPTVVIRSASREDASECGRICYEAFAQISSAHAFPCDFAGPEVCVGLLSMLFSSSEFYSVVAESEGRIVGSNCLDERSVISGVGPISVASSAQDTGIGRKLMQAVINRADGQSAAGVRLVQSAYHNRSFSLYLSLGFDVREPLSCLQGRTRERKVPGYDVRTALSTDLEACNALARRVHGFDRGTELAQAVGRNSASVVERGGRVTGYATALAFFGHATAETNLDLQALIASAESFGGAGILVPSRNNALLRWCIANGLRVVQPMTLMSMGLYNEPTGAWLPSVVF